MIACILLSCMTGLLSHFTGFASDELRDIFTEEMEINSKFYLRKMENGNPLKKGMLYPRPSESRTVMSLDGMWKFRADISPTRNEGFVKKWYSKPLVQTGDVIPMPVPASFNDITQNKTLRDFVGWVWYETEFFVPTEWQDRRVILRIGSAHYNTIVWVNSHEVMTHSGGHLPFETMLNSSVVVYTGTNRLTVAVNNTVTPFTLPPGEIIYKHDLNRYPPGYFTQNINFDFFNYAGIHRSVKLYTTPNVYIDDITIVTYVEGVDGFIDYTVSVKGSARSVFIEIVDENGKTVTSSESIDGRMVVGNANFWWPYGISRQATAYMYIFKVTLKSNYGTDIYRQPFGIRNIKLTDSKILINDRPFYCHGVGKHEDADIRGKGLDFPMIAKDFNLLKWLGATCMRTSVYPYAEEIMDQADQQGIAIINESPGIGIISAANYKNESLIHHMSVMDEMVRRDKNRPAVIMWSVANEPNIRIPEAKLYFKTLIEHTKSLDFTRPVTLVTNDGPVPDYATEYVDLILVNIYYGWYSDCGHTELIQRQVKNNLLGWRERTNKPIMVSEYGADTIAGLHQDPSFVFTEEYQVDFLGEYHKVFDEFRDKFLVGEMVWVFADFMTAQEIIRVVGNRKGLFTRQRQPKMSAHLIRSRYQSLLNKTGQS